MAECLRSTATRSSGTRPPGRIKTRSARPVIISMLRVNESREALMESRTLVNTAAPRAIPKSTVKTRHRCLRMLRRLNQTKNRRKKSTFCRVDAFVKFNSAAFFRYCLVFGVQCFVKAMSPNHTKHKIRNTKNTMNSSVMNSSCLIHDHAVFQLKFDGRQ